MNGHVTTRVSRWVSGLPAAVILAAAAVVAAAATVCGAEAALKSETAAGTLPPVPLPYRGTTPPAFTRGRLKLYLVIGSSMMVGLTRKDTAMCPIRPEDYAPHPRLLYFRSDLGQWSDSAGSIWGSGPHAGAPELLGRALVEQDRDHYIGIVAYTRFATLFKDWSFAKRPRMPFSTLQSVRKAIQPVFESVIRTGHGRWCGVLYVGGGANRQDAMRSVRDLRKLLGVADLPVAATGIPADELEAAGEKRVVQIPVTLPQGRIHYWYADPGTYSFQDSHYGRDGHAAMGRMAAAAFDALERGERVRFVRRRFALRPMGALQGPRVPLGMSADGRGSCYVLGSDESRGAVRIVRFGHRKPDRRDLDRPRPVLREDPWRTVPGRPDRILASGPAAMLAEGRRMLGWFQFGEKDGDGKPVTRWKYGAVTGELFGADGALDVGGRPADLSSDGGQTCWALAGDARTVYVLRRDHRHPFHMAAVTNIIMPMAVGVVAGSYGRVYALSDDGSRLVSWYQPPARSAWSLLGARRSRAASSPPPPPPPPPVWTTNRLSRPVRGAHCMTSVTSQDLLLVGARDGLYAVSTADGWTEPVTGAGARPLFAVDGTRELVWTADRDTGRVTLSRLTWDMVPDAAAGVRVPPPPPPPVAPSPQKNFVRVEATVRRVSALPSAASFPPPPYKSGLLCLEYTVDRVLDGEAPPASRLLAVIPAVVNGRSVLHPMPAPGNRYLVTATPVADRHDGMTLPVADDIQDFTVPLYYVVGAEPIVSGDAAAPGPAGVKATR